MPQGPSYLESEEASIRVNETWSDTTIATMPMDEYQSILSHLPGLLQELSKDTVPHNFRWVISVKVDLHNNPKTQSYGELNCRLRQGGEASSCVCLQSHAESRWVRTCLSPLCGLIISHSTPMPYGMGCILSPLRSKNYRINRACEGKMPSRQPAGRRRYRCAACRPAISGPPVLARGSVPAAWSLIRHRLSAAGRSTRWRLSVCRRLRRRGQRRRER